MATTYEAIATVTVGSGGAANIEFTSIPGTYTDLVIHLSGRTTRNDTADDIGIELNNVTPTGFPDSSGNYTNKRLLGYSGSTSGVGSDANGGQEAGIASGATATSSSFGSTFIYIPNYTSTNKKSLSTDSVSETNTGNAVQVLIAGLVNLTSAVSSIKLLSRQSGSWVQYTTATLYGIKNS
jgi:hypothetical protein